MDQIAKQLKSGTLDAAADQHSLSDVQDENDTSLYSQLDNEVNDNLLLHFFHFLYTR